MNYIYKDEEGFPVSAKWSYTNYIELNNYIWSYIYTAETIGKLAVLAT